ncbi:MAG TPA: DUF4238 domain-containing protein, partial [Ignavibacteriaceae bacterium]
YNLTPKLKEKYSKVKDNIIEIAAFKEYETNIARLTKLFKDGHRDIKRSDFEMIIKGYVGQKYRTPFLREEFSNEPKMKRIRDKVFEEIKDEFRRNTTNMHIIANYLGYTAEGEFEKLKEQALGFGTDSHIDLHLWGLMKSINDANEAVNKSVHTLMHMDINILCAPQGHYFLTSDNPGVSIKNATQKRKEIYNTDYKHCHEFIFPITSSKAIQLSKPHIGNFPMVTRRVLYRAITEDYTRMINEGTIILANERVFCADEQYLKTFIDSYTPEPI